MYVQVYIIVYMLCVFIKIYSTYTSGGGCCDGLGMYIRVVSLHGSAVAHILVTSFC